MISFIEQWIKETTPFKDVTDWEWDGETLTVFTQGGVEHYSHDVVFSEIAPMFVVEEATKMDRAGLLQYIAAEHGNQWPLAALQRMLKLAAVSEKTNEEDFEYSLLVDWSQEMIEKGVSFTGAAWQNV